MTVHYPDKNRYRETLSLCGESIKKVHTGYGYCYKQDSTKITANFYLVNCVECLKNLLIKENNRLSIIANRILELEKEKQNG